MRFFIILLVVWLVPQISKADSFQVDWTLGVITATATGFSNPGAPDLYASAQSAARDEVLALLLQAAKGIHVTNSQTVDQLGSKYSAIETRLDGIVKNVLSLSEPTFRTVGNDIEATVKATMCLHNSGTDACTGRESVKTLIDSVAPPSHPKKKYATCDVSIQDLEGEALDGDYKSLLINLNGVPGYLPSLNAFPLSVVFLNGANELCSVSDPSSLDKDVRENLKKNNMSMIVSDSSVPNDRIKKKIKEVKAQKIEDPYIFVSERDGKMINVIDKKAGGIFTRQGQIGIVTRQAVQTVNTAN